MKKEFKMFGDICALSNCNKKATGCSVSWKGANGTISFCKTCAKQYTNHDNLRCCGIRERAFNEVLEIIEDKINTQKRFLNGNFQHDKPINWRIIGFKDLVSKIKRLPK